MQIVIDIPEILYTKIQNGKADKRTLETVILHGTPLPKGHGRLIDADILDEVKEMVTTDTGDYKYAVLMDNIRLIPTIIEAESEESNGTL